MSSFLHNSYISILSSGLFIKSIIQGLVIFVASFSTYYILLDNNVDNAPTARAMGLVIIMISNLFLVQVNSSNHDFVFQSIGRLMKDKVMWAVNIFTIIGILIILYTPIGHFLGFEPLSTIQFLGAVVIGGVAVLWYELVKLVRKLAVK